MGDVTRILSEIENGARHATDELFPIVYAELRKLATQRMAREKPGQTLQPTALVHEAYMRLVDVERAQRWKSRGHFFGAAAQAMRRILVERARGRASEKRGGGRQRVDLSAADVAVESSPEDLLALDEALHRLEESDPVTARLVDLRYFAGLSMPQAAEALGVSLRTAERNWAYARTWLHRELARAHTT
jgi:RNA polymerase sigma factor (TIGR02999 family)